MTDKRIVFTTAGDRKEAEDIAWGLVERKLAACVNMCRWNRSIAGRARSKSIPSIC